MERNDAYFTLTAAIEQHVLPRLTSAGAAVNAELACLPSPPESTSSLPLRSRVQVLAALFRAATLDRVSALVLNLLWHDRYTGDPLAVLRDVIGAVDPGMPADAQEEGARVRVAWARAGKLEGCHYAFSSAELAEPVAPELIRALRGGMTAQELARRTGVTPETLSRWERGHRTCRLSRFTTLRELLARPVSLPEIPAVLVAEGLRSQWSVQDLVRRAVAAEQAQARISRVPAYLVQEGLARGWSVVTLLSEARVAAQSGEAA